MAKNRINDRELKAIVNSEIRSAMGEIGGELADDRSDALDYYYGEKTGKLAAVADDRSDIVITTVRDTIEWIMPQLMRMFAHADSVVEFNAVGAEDEEAAEQETQAINHIFWHQNNGFLTLYSWVKDGLLSKNGVVKFWLEETERRSREEYDGLTFTALARMLSDQEITLKQYAPSEQQSVDGQPLFYAVFERYKKSKDIKVEEIPPEEFLVSADARSVDIRGRMPRFVGHRTEKTASELMEMGFDKADIEKMVKSGDERDDKYDEEWIARHNITDEDDVGESYSHESLRKIALTECYMRLDRNGDGYAEMLRIYKAGDFIEAEECDSHPFAAWSPLVMPHKYIGQSIYDLVKDLQEIHTAIMRSTLDNMYQTNNMRPVVNERVDLDSLLTTKPGAPIYVDDMQPVGDAIAPFAPPPLWKESVGLMEYLDEVRKERTGVGDATMGLDPKQLQNAQTGVVLEAMEAARAKIELVARLFAETGMRSLFRGIHELARKSYDQPLRYKLRNQYIEVSPNEWRERTNLTVKVGTATGDQQRELFALTQIAQVQEKMVAGGMMGVTLLPQHLYETGKRLAECLGEKDGATYFMDPMLRANPQFQQIAQIQMPQPQADPQMEGIKMMAQVEQAKAQIQQQKMQLDYQTKIAELQLKNEEVTAKAILDKMKQEVDILKERQKSATDTQKVAIDAELKERDQALQSVKQAIDQTIANQRAEVDVYKAQLQAYIDLEQKKIDVQNQQKLMAEQSKKASEKTSADVGALVKELRQSMADFIADAKKPKMIKRDKDGKPISVGDLAIVYNGDGTIESIG